MCFIELRLVYDGDDDDDSDGVEGVDDGAEFDVSRCKGFSRSCITVDSSDWLVEFIVVSTGFVLVRLVSV